MAAPALHYRVLVEVGPVDLGGRSSDALPASLDLDSGAAAFAGLDLTHDVSGLMAPVLWNTVECDTKATVLAIMTCR